MDIIYVITVTNIVYETTSLSFDTNGNLCFYDLEDEKKCFPTSYIYRITSKI